ncbi:MAG: nitroreductase family protein [Spirochaetales bacterium]|nr:nitroreductase family protein [Spirochaetales bacterium]
MEIDEFISLLKARKSIRRFKRRKPIPAQAEQLLLEAARLAPSAGNQQTWHFFVIKDDLLKDIAVKAAYGQGFIGQASLVIVVAVDKERAFSGYGRRGLDLYCLQDTAAAIENMLLAAAALGLAACWVGAFDERELELGLDIDSRRYRPVAILPVGYADEAPAHRSRLPLDRVTTYL